MAGKDASQPVPSPAPMPPNQVAALQEDVHPLGVALRARVADVLARTGERIRALGHGRDPAIQRRFERMNESSTIAIASWLSGEGPEVARDAGRQTWRLYGELAARRTASLQELTERHLCWRDSVVEVLRESASEIDLPQRALDEALNVVQVSLEFSLVRMCKSYDRERRRTDDELAASKEELAFVATHDELTGLPNRALIVDRVEQMLARAPRSGSAVAAMSIDLDNFKTVNDTLGRSAGDELLQAVATRLDGVLRGGDTLGRLGGNEFVVICEGASLDAGPELIAERLLEALKPSFALAASEDMPVAVTASLGVALGGRTSAEELLRDANAAMYRAKRDGRNRYALYETGMQHTIRQRAELEMGLRHALERDELFLAYQPVFDLADMRVIAMEALIRWSHPGRGIVPPNEFIPLAEETGLIPAIGAWVLRRACSQGAAWRRAGCDAQIAVNVSARQLDGDQLLADVNAALVESGLAPKGLILEVTETALMRNVDDTVHRLRAIKELGPRIAIDDFGTGYSSLAHLQRFPVDALKIDRSFVSRLGESTEADAFIHTLVQLGKTLSLETVAEGIERDEELAKLRDEGCESGQGFLFARPLDVADAEALLLQRGAAVATTAVVRASGRRATDSRAA
jgi:diguanylate cyclase (GGDEF)-like protein